MKALGTQLGRGIFFMLGASLLCSTAMAQQAGAPIDPYAPAPPAVVPAPPPQPAPAPPPAAAPATPSQSASGGSSNSSNNNTNNIQANPTNNNTANQNNTSTNTNNNTNDNRSTATATNNNTIYIYPPAYPPPAPPPVVAPPSPLAPPPLVPPPLVRAPLYRSQRIRLNCAQLCSAPPALIPPPMMSNFSPLRERFRPFAMGAHVTVLGMARQPLAGWGTLAGGGFHVSFRSRGRFGFEFAQDFLRGQYKFSDNGNVITRHSFPVDFTFRGYILPNHDKHHFNLYFGGGFGAMASSIDGAGPYGGSQTFLEWTLHGDVGAELRFKWLALGLDGKVMAIVRDKNFGDGIYYGGVNDGAVPNKTWGLQGRGYLSFWF